jgi:zona occludens toxin
MRYSLRRQRGFLYLTTGANGSGKTLFTLEDVRELQLKTNRPVFYKGFTPKQPIHDFGWKPFEPANWQELPDSSILIVDECQDDFPIRGPGKPPDWIGAILSEHRKRGFDFFLITQHPLNIDAFIRRTVASPGWHRHMKASFMGDSSNELKWTAVKTQPEAPGSGKSGFITKRSFPKHVYDWYESSSDHTAVKKVPLKLIMAGVGILAALGMFGYVAWGFYAQAKGKSPETPPAQSAVQASNPSQASVAGPARSSEKQPLTAAEYAASYVPRIRGLEHTAPAYDGLTAPKVAPLPSACIQWAGKGCKCFTQRGTPYRTSDEICVQIVKHGIFLPFEEDRQERANLSKAAPAEGAKPL